MTKLIKTKCESVVRQWFENNRTLCARLFRGLLYARWTAFSGSNGIIDPQMLIYGLLRAQREHGTGMLSSCTSNREILTWERSILAHKGLSHLSTQIPGCWPGAVQMSHEIVQSFNVTLLPFLVKTGRVVSEVDPADYLLTYLATIAKSDVPLLCSAFSTIREAGSSMGELNRVMEREEFEVANEAYSTELRCFIETVVEGPNLFELVDSVPSRKCFSDAALRAICKPARSIEPIDKSIVTARSILAGIAIETEFLDWCRRVGHPEWPRLLTLENPLVGEVQTTVRVQCNQSVQLDVSAYNTLCWAVTMAAAAGVPAIEPSLLLVGILSTESDTARHVIRVGNRQFVDFCAMWAGSRWSDLEVALPRPQQCAPVMPEMLRELLFG